MHTWAMALQGIVVVWQIYLVVVLLKWRRIAKMESANNRTLSLQIKYMKQTLDSIVADQKKHMQAIEQKVQRFSEVVARVQKVMLGHHPEDKRE